jgi:PAP2 superfamily/FG-GAP-like repeat
MRLENRDVPSNGSVLRWNSFAADAVRDEYAIGHTPDQGGPTRDSRALAIVQASVFDAVNSIDGSYQPYKFKVPAAPGASIDAAVAAAAHDTLVALFPSFKARFDSLLATDLAALPTVPAQNGAAVGHSVAAQMLALRANDNSSAMMSYMPINQPGYWQPDPLHPGQMYLTPDWGNVTPFTMNSGSQFRVPAPPALNSPEYTAAFNEVKAFGGDGVTTPTIRTAAETQIGLFWAYDGTPGLGTPPRLYNQIAEAIAQQQGNTDVANARMFALINLAMADAGIQCWDSKLYYSLWRPVTAIRDAGADGNADTAADATWTPLGAPASNSPPGSLNFTPPFPAYASGHATFGGALFRTLADFYGTDHISFSFMSDELNGITKDNNGVVRAPVVRHFDSFSQAAEENGQSRIYLGIHWSFDKINGIAAGTEIADNAFAHFLRANPKAQRLITGADASGGPQVRVVDSANGQQLFSFFAFDQSFRGGVRVAMGDVNGDGTPDIITAAGPGGGPHIKVFDGTNLHLLYSFFAYDAAFHGGVFVAAGDINGDGYADIVTGADASGGSHVKVFSGKDGSVLRSFFAYSAGFTGGVRVAAGDVNGDGRDDIITGAGPGGGPHVEVFSGVDGSLYRSFFAYDPSFQGGVFVAAGDCDGNGRADIVTGAGAGGGPHVKVFNYKGALLQSFFAFQPQLQPSFNGVHVGCTDFNGDGRADLLTGAGRGDAPVIECRDAMNLNQIDRQYAYDPSFLGGVNVGGAA